MEADGNETLQARTGRDWEAQFHARVSAAAISNVLHIPPASRFITCPFTLDRWCSFLFYMGEMAFLNVTAGPETRKEKTWLQNNSNVCVEEVGVIVKCKANRFG